MPNGSLKFKLEQTGTKYKYIELWLKNLSLKMNLRDLISFQQEILLKMFTG